jgi:hypothetical protein
MGNLAAMLELCGNFSTLFLKNMYFSLVVAGIVFVS